jgi:hypothetical protein
MNRHGIEIKYHEQMVLLFKKFIELEKQYNISIIKRDEQLKYYDVVYNGENLFSFRLESPIYLFVTLEHSTYSAYTNINIDNFENVINDTIFNMRLKEDYNKVK